MYLQAPDQEALCYKDCYEEQEQKYCCKVIMPMRDSLQVLESMTDLECVQAPNQEALCYKDRYEEWEQKYCCKVITSTRDTFQDMFDDDNTLAYEPESTAAVILCGSDEEAEAAAFQVRKFSLKGNHSHCWGEVLLCAQWHIRSQRAPVAVGRACSKEGISKWPYMDSTGALALNIISTGVATRVLGP